MPSVQAVAAPPNSALARLLIVKIAVSFSGNHVFVDLGVLLFLTRVGLVRFPIFAQVAAVPRVAGYALGGLDVGSVGEREVHDMDLGELVLKVGRQLFDFERSLGNRFTAVRRSQLVFATNVLVYAVLAHRVVRVVLLFVFSKFVDIVTTGTLIAV